MWGEGRSPHTTQPKVGGPSPPQKNWGGRVPPVLSARYAHATLMVYGKITPCLLDVMILLGIMYPISYYAGFLGRI